MYIWCDNRRHRLRHKVSPSSKNGSPHMCPQQPLASGGNCKNYSLNQKDHKHTWADSEMPKKISKKYRDFLCCFWSPHIWIYSKFYGMGTVPQHQKPSNTFWGRSRMMFRHVVAAAHNRKLGVEPNGLFRQFFLKFSHTCDHIRRTWMEFRFFSANLQHLKSIKPLAKGAN